MRTKSLAWRASNQNEWTARINSPPSKHLFVSRWPQQGSDVGAQWCNSEHLLVRCAGVRINVHSAADLIGHRPCLSGRESVRHTAAPAEQVNNLDRRAISAFLISICNAWHYGLSTSRNLESTLSNRASFRTSHSQMTHTLHPSRLSFLMFVRSRFKLL